MALIHPYEELAGGFWLRGNLHAHSTQSDGVASPQQVIDNYAALKHDFLMLADHEVLTSEEQLAGYESHGMILIPGLEIAGGPHLLYVDADQKLPPRQPRQAILNQISELAQQRGRGFAIMNHPNWQEQFDHATLAQLQEWVGYAGIEIYNGVIRRLDGSPYALEKWDSLLATGRTVWGYANDDSHQGAVESGLGWNVVYAYERSVAGICDALRNGRFYASTGVEITSIAVNGNVVRVETANAERIAAIRDVGRRVVTVDQSWIEVEVPPAARYLRIQCWGRGEAMAWTQPFVPGIGGEKTVKANPYLRQWQISSLITADNLDDASPAEADKANHSYSPVKADSATTGFIELTETIRGANGIVYARAEIEGAQSGDGSLKLAYDGPVRIWLNDEEIFHGPGTNPALPDKLHLYVKFRDGTNHLLIAIHSNNGSAWGIRCLAEQGGRTLATPK